MLSVRYGGAQIWDDKFDELMNYDDECFVRPGSPWRRELMSRWIKIQGGLALVAVDGKGHVVGYGCRRPAITAPRHHYIGPLYADSYEIASDLLQGLTRVIVGQNIRMIVM